MAAGACCRAGHDRPFGAHLDGDETRHRVGHGAGHDKGADGAPALFHHLQRARLDLGDAAAARRHEDADTVAVVIRDLEPRVGQSLARDGHGKLRRAVDAPRRLAIHVVGRVKALDLAGNVVRHVFGVETGDLACAGLSRQQILPECLHVVADRRHCAHACNENARHLETHFRFFWERLVRFFARL